MTITASAVPADNALPVTAVTAASALARYEQACRAVAEVTSVDEVREISATADALRAYARQARNRKLELDAVEIRIRAERRLGEMMAAQKSAVGPNVGGRPKTGLEANPVFDPPTLAEAGMEKNLAHRARTLAAVPAQKFEELLDDKRRRDDPRLVLAPDAPRPDSTSLKVENEALSAEVATLQARVSALQQENRMLKELVMRWKERAILAEGA